MSYAMQRTNMVESQVRPSDVTDRRILRAMSDVPREAFVAEAQRPLAYQDGAIKVLSPRGARRTLLAPRTFAKLLQAAAIEPGQAVLIVGALRGYSAAIAARLCDSVVALECEPEFRDLMQAALKAAGADGVVPVTGELAQGWSDGGPYDVIVVEGAIEDTPEVLLEQLKDGGRLVAIHGRGPTGRATVWTRNDGTFGAVALFDAAGDVLPGFERAEEFVL